MYIYRYIFFGVILCHFPYNLCIVRRVDKLSHSDRSLNANREQNHLWSPRVPTTMLPDFRPTQLCDTTEFKQLTTKLERLIANMHQVSLFDWYSVSLTRLKGMKRSYLLLGGSSAKQHSNGNPKLAVTPRDGGSVFLCELELKGSAHNLGFGPTSRACIRLSEKETQHETIGVSSSTIEITENMSALTYCDSLWRATKHVPVGRCFLQLLQHGEVDRTIEFSEFCQSGLQVTTPCMAGHSVHLSKMTSKNIVQQNQDPLENVRMWVGQPLFLSSGRVQTISGPFTSARFTTANRPDDSFPVGTQFGYSVVDGFATAPGIAKTTNEKSPVAQLFAIEASTDGIMTIEWIGGANNTDKFSGYGTSLLRVNLGSTIKTGIIVGAPYASQLQKEYTKDTSSTMSNTTNHGRVYLYCRSVGASGVAREIDRINMPNDVIDGPPDAYYFGFSLSSLGDVDGDGINDLAIGAPDLDNPNGRGLVYIMRLLSNCTFDLSPIQTLQGPIGAYDFGAHLPANAEDLDFNGWPDLVIPTKINLASSKTLSPLIYAIRSQVMAKCKFSFPTWLAVRRLVTGETIPISVSIYLSSLMRDQTNFNPTAQILTDENDRRLFHQVRVDWNLTKPGSERFKLLGDITSSADIDLSTLVVNFNIMAKHDVEDMGDIDSDVKGLFIGYRFQQHCFGDGMVLDNSGTCSNGTGLKRPIITWSEDCIARVPIPRYVCYPRPSCESDLSLRVKGRTSDHTLFYKQTDTSTSEINGSQSMVIDLRYGDMTSSRQEAIIEIFNFGPTFARGVWLELQYTGNLRFLRIEKLVKVSQNPEAKLVSYTVSENETWVSFFLGLIPQTTYLTENDQSSESLEPNFRLNVSSLYVNFSNTNYVNFSLGASVRIHLHSGTPDPNMFGNSIELLYRVVHSPSVRLSYGPDFQFVKTDNRTKPHSWLPGYQRRVDVSEIGPQLKHTMQVEYIGPSEALKNVQFHLSIPSKLNLLDHVGRRDPYIVYLFREIRASKGHSAQFEWIDVSPKVLVLRNGSRKTYQNIGQCNILNSDEIVNPRGMLGMDAENFYSRQRRDVPVNIERESVDEMNVGNRSHFPTNTNQLNETKISDSTIAAPLSFKRVLKEILQCDRVGYNLRKPICAEVICELDELKKNRPVLITFTGWLWARALFDKHISDLDLVTTLLVNQGQIPEGVVPASEPIGHFNLVQTFFFREIRTKLIHQIPVWPIVVGVVSGIIVLALLIILLYVLGFFKRHRPPMRQAQYSRGGAAELERNQDDSLETSTPKHVLMEQPSPTHQEKPKRKSQHKGELRILHPADLVQNRDDQHLLEQSPSN